MALEIMASKLFAPALKSGFLSRPRLTGVLRQSTASKLVLVSAPAGFGKTAFLADCLAQMLDEENALAWLSLDVSDRDPATFWTGVVTALQKAVPGLAAGVMEQLTSSPLPVEQVLITVLQGLASWSEVPDGQRHEKLHGSDSTPESEKESPKHELWLMLDDYHLADNREIATGMVFLLEHLPPSVHALISTRADPDLPLSRWRAREELLEIRAADLRFTAEETVEYFNAVHGVDLKAAEAAALSDKTEGWIAALQLAGLSLKGHTDVAGFIGRFTGDDRYILDYLLEEVLAQQPAEIRSFLLHSSVLDRLTGPLCDAVMGGDAVTSGVSGESMLAAMERENLFLIPLDHQRQWYRYHRLFADMLRARLLSEEPELIPQLHERASHWFEGEAMAAEAIGHALAAKNFDRAAHLMEMAATQIRRERRDALFLGWLDELPYEVVRLSPVLTVFRAFSLMAAGELDDVEPHLVEAERTMAAVPQGDDSP